MSPLAPVAPLPLTVKPSVPKAVKEFEIVSSTELSLLFNAFVTPLTASNNTWSVPEPAARHLIQVKSG